MCGVFGVNGVVLVVGLGYVGVVWVLRTKTSQQQEEEQLYPLLDHTTGRLVKNELHRMCSIQLAWARD